MFYLPDEFFKALNEYIFFLSLKGLFFLLTVPFLLAVRNFSIRMQYGINTQSYDILTVSIIIIECSYCTAPLADS